MISEKVSFYYYFYSKAFFLYKIMLPLINYLTKSLYFCSFVSLWITLNMFASVLWQFLMSFLFMKIAWYLQLWSFKVYNLLWVLIEQDWISQYTNKTVMRFGGLILNSTKFFPLFESADVLALPNSSY